MTIQYIIIFIVLLAALGYSYYRARQVVKHANDRCYGCSGCALHDALMKSRKRTSYFRTRQMLNQCKRTHAGRQRQ